MGRALFATCSRILDFLKNDSRQLVGFNWSPLSWGIPEETMGGGLRMAALYELAADLRAANLAY